DAASAPLKISGGSPASSQVGSFRIVPSSARVTFLRDEGSGFELFETRLDGGGEPERRSSAMVAGGDVLSFQLDAKGRAYYLADQEFDGSPELFLSLQRERDLTR